MKKLFLIAGLSSMAFLGGCAGLTPANLSAAVAAYEAEVQADTNLVCGFIPTVATIVALIPGTGAIAPAAASVAEAVCAAVAKAPVPASAKLRSVSNMVAVNVGKVYVPGFGPVAISGTFTR